VQAPNIVLDDGADLIAYMAQREAQPRDCRNRTDDHRCAAAAGDEDGWRAALSGDRAKRRAAQANLNRKTIGLAKVKTQARTFL
jgi:hypothetical protein